FVPGVRDIERADSNRFFDRDALLWSPDVALPVRARDFRLERHHGNEFSRRIVRGLRRTDTLIDKTPERKHVIETLGAVEAHFLAVVINVGRERRGDGAESLDTGNETVVDHGAVLEPEPRIAPRMFFLQALVNAEGGVDCHVSV